MEKIVITGCAGFIGCHLTKRFLDSGATVIGIDDLSRPGSEINLKWLKSHSDNFIFHRNDIRDYHNVESIFKNYNEIKLVIHEAGQVAVTTSVLNPRLDFEANALGTLNLLEATRFHAPDAVFIFASTNKVYGKMADLAVIERHGRYEYETLVGGVNEKYCLDFHSPYGCSKGVADQYVRDYSRIYGLKSVVLRQSCIYGTRQYGMEDQGWVAWFTIASILKKPITIYGDGKQGRDVLWIDDLVEAYVRCYQNAEKVAGEIYNIGGGPQNILSLLELVDYLQASGVMIRPPACEDWRPGDQKIYVSDIGKISAAIQWKPTISPQEGIGRLITWVRNNKPLLDELFLKVK